MALEAHQLIQEWAKELKIEKYFSLIEENEYRSNPLNPPLPKREGMDVFPTLEKGGKGGFSDIQQEPASQMAVTMYCLSALQYFQDKDLEEIKKVGFEIAMLGRQGIDPVKTDKKYYLESLPGKEFTGLQLLAYMYSAFQVIDPFLDTEMNYKKEYEMAKGMFEKGKS